MKKGFTLVELLLSISVIVALLAISVPVFWGLNSRADIDASKETVEIILRKAQAQARNQKNNTEWGVYIDSANSNIILFAGTTYAGRAVSFTSLDETFTIPTDVVINSDSPQEIVFNQLTGDLEGSTQTVNFVLGSLTKQLQVSDQNGAITEILN